MGKLYSYFFFLMLPILASGQLYIGDNTASSYVYNKGEIIYVTQNIQLEGSPIQDAGNLYMRDEGQLIQGNDASPNAGNGVISLLQTNTRNLWDYHYWTSPVGDPTKSASGNGNTGNVNFYMSGDDNGGLYQTDASDPLGASEVIFTTNYNSSIASINDFSLSSYWLYKFVASNGYGSWSKVSSTNPTRAGEGFTMKGLGNGTSPSGIVPIDFRGRPNNGTINVDVAASNLSLVGNPYPSAMNLSFYLLSNSGASSAMLADCIGTFDPATAPTAVNNSITGLAYFWESDPNVKSHYIQDYQGGYGTFSPLLACNSAGEYSPAVFITYDNDGERVLTERPNTVENGGPINDPDGNPYPFFPELDTDGNVVFDSDGNVVYVMDPVPTGLEGENIPRYWAPVGQGFFVEAIANGVVTAKNEFRYFIKESQSANSQFKSKYEPKKVSKKSSEKSTASLKPNQLTYDEEGLLVMPKFRITTHINDTYYRKISGVFYDDATMGFDIAGDGDNVNALPSDVSFIVEESPRDVIINLFPYDIDAVLPLKISGNKETNTFKMQVLELNFVPDESIFLHDKETDEYHDILNRPYEIKLPQGTYKERFEIVFKDAKAATLEVAEEVKKSFAVYQNNNRAELTVLNPLETDLKEINVFDISGKLLVSKLNEGSKSKIVIPSGNWSDGIYIIKVITRDNVEFAKKVSVINMK
ncbi:T9SS type A sorting domain-containing protein [Leeuwenhoekiella sp. W20_SRS_FM14]|uniref:T9SS type A sorting domain-containing protein n=1 Tax=Leeuwenhoekiella sp. W20_SRS_FM14 TaxID=3240270 RepID=UPI003F94CA29